MQDNAPIYTARIVKAWFQERDIDIVNWLPYSPDLNLIENLQKILKAKIIKLYSEFTIIKNNKQTKALLIQAAKEVWDLLKDQLLNKLASGMQKRVNAIKTAKEQYTKY